MFGRATIRLGIGPHSSLFYFTLFLTQTLAKLLTQIYTTEFHRVSRTMDAVFSEKNTPSLFLHIY